MNNNKYYYISFCYETVSFPMSFDNMLSGNQTHTTFLTAMTVDGKSIDLTEIHKKLIEAKYRNPVILGCCGLDKKEYDYFTELAKGDNEKKQKE